MSGEHNRSNYMKSFALAAFGLSGAAALIYEVAWARALANIMGGTTQAVSTMLSAFMGGLALGGYLGAGVAGRSKNPLLLFGMMEAGIGVFGLLTIPAINSLSPLYFLVFNKYHLQPEMFFSMQFALCFAIMAVPTTLMGAAFPVVARIAGDDGDGVAAGAGRAYSVNSLGALAGSFSAGFILIPILGLKGATQLAAGVNILVALAAIMSSSSARKTFYTGLAIFSAAGANAMAMKSEPREFDFSYYLASNRYRDYVDFTGASENFKSLFRKDDPQGTVQVYFNTTDNILMLKNGGRIEASTYGGDIENMLFSVNFPVAANPKAKSMLGIGLGSGISMKAALYRMSDVTWVEINPAIAEAASRYFYPDMFRSGAKVVIDDARNYLQTTDKKYDVITSYPSFPADSGSGRLYTKEFFEIAASRLNPDGVMCQWVPYFMYSEEALKVLLKTFHNSFPHITAMRTDVSGDLFLLGSKKPLKTPMKKVVNGVYKMKEFDVIIRFKPWRTPEPPAKLVKHSAHLPFNTDDKPILEFLGARAMLMPVDRLPAQGMGIY